MRNHRVVRVAAVGALAFSIQCTDGLTVPDTAPAAIAAVTTIAQSAVSGGLAVERPAVKVTNSSGSPVAGIAVTFAIASGGGSVSGGSQTTDADGVAIVGGWTLGTVAGPNAMTASIQILPSVTFSATGIPGPPTKLIATIAPSASAQNRIAFPVQPAVQLQDVNGNNVAQNGTAVATAIASGGGALSGSTTATSGPAGLATFENLAIAGSVGARTLAFSAAGLTSATADITITAGAASMMAMNGGNNQLALVGAAVATTPSVRITDADANAVSGRQVTFAVTGGGGTIIGATATSGTDGVASVGAWTLGTMAGANTLAATSSGLTGSPVVFAATGTAGAASTIAINAGDGQTAAAGSAVATVPSVIVRDANNNGVFGVGVIFAVASGGGTVSAASTTTNASGIATAGSWTVGNTAGENTLTATATGLTAVTFTATGTAGPGSSMAIDAGNNQSAAVGSAVSPPSVIVKDSHGNAVKGVIVTFAVASGGGNYTGAAKATGVDGVAAADIGGWHLGQTAGTNTLTATSSGLIGSPVTFTATGLALEASTLAVTVQPSNTVAGAAMIPAVQIAARDQSGNTATTFNGVISLAIASNPSSGSLGGTTSQTAVDGVATFPGLSVDKSGTGYTLEASAANLTPVSSSAFDILTGTAAQLAFSVQPTSTTVGAAIAPAMRVTIHDANGNVASTATNSITLAIGSNPGAATLGGTNTVAAVNGVATFSSVTISAPGIGYTLTASAASLVETTSSVFNVVGPSAQLLFSSQPPNGVTNASLSPAVKVRVADAIGQTVSTATNAVTLAIGTNAGSATLGGTVTANAVNGEVAFANLTISAAGTGYTLTAAATGLPAESSAPFDIAAFGAATKLAFLVQPTNASVSAVMSPAVQVVVQDAHANTVTSSSASITVAIGSNPGSATLAGTLTASAAGGVASFPNLALNSAGAGYTLVASSSALTTASSGTFSIVDPNAPIKLAFIQQPTNTTAGSTLVPDVTVAIQNGSGATVTTDNSTQVTVEQASAPTGGTLRGTVTATAVNGVATFSTLNDTVAGDYTLRATAAGLTPSVSAFYTITAGVPAHLGFIAPSTTVRAGDLFSPPLRITVQDVYNNVVTTASNSITMEMFICISGNCGQRFNSLAGTTTVTATNGVATFTDLRARTAGSYCVQPRSGPLEMPLCKLRLTITPSTIKGVRVAVPPAPDFPDYPPSPQTANVSFVATGFLIDSLGNDTNTGSNVISLALGTNPGAATLSLANNMAAVDGRAAFNVSIDKPGSAYTIVGSSSGLTSGVSPAFNVLAFGSPIRLGFQVQPANTSVGAAISPAIRVCVEDEVGNGVTTATNTITIAIGTNPGGASLGGTLSLAAVGGCASFSNLTLSAAGSGYRLRASASELTGATSGEFTVAPAGPPAGLVFAGPLANTVANAPLSPAGLVETHVVDATGNVVTDATNTITVAIAANPGSATLNGTKVFVPVEGKSILGADLELTAAGTGYTITATSPGLQSATSSAFNVAAHAMPFKTVFKVGPSNTVVGEAISPAIQVAIVDEFGNTVSSGADASGIVTILFGAQTPRLLGTLSVAAVAGVATFLDVAVADVNTGYSVYAAAGDVSGDASEPFDVTSGGTLLATASGTPYGLAVTGNTIVWAQADGVFKMPTTGGSVTQLASFPAVTGGNLGGLVTDGTTVFFGSYDTTGLSIHRVPLAGGPLTSVSIGLPGISFNFALDNDYIYFAGGSTWRMSKTAVSWTTNSDTELYAIGSNSSTNPGEDAFVVNAGQIFFNEGFAIHRAPSGGGGPITDLTTEPALGLVMALQGATLYYAASNGGSLEVLLRSVATTGGASTTVSILAAGAERLVMAGANAYIQSGQGIYKIRLSDGTNLRVDYADAQGFVAADATSVYWLRNSSGSMQLFKAPR